jgi:ferric enterobactin receptor
MRARVLLFAAVGLLFAGNALAQCRLEGVVRLADGTPLADASVRLEGPEYRKPLTTTTGPDGRYVFDKVTPGTHAQIIVTRAGRVVAQGYTLVTLQVERLDIQEQLTPDTPQSTGDVIGGQGETGDVGGIVRSADGHLVTTAVVSIGETVLSTETDAGGRYLFGSLKPGMRIKLQAAAPGYKTATKEVVVPAGTRLAADFVLEPGGAAEGTGVGLAAVGTAPESDRVVAAPEQAASLPSLGQDDVFRALQFLPGVLTSNESSADFYVRGGASDQNLVTLDGFTLYPLEHVFGALSPYNVYAIRTVDFSRTALSVTDGGRLAGALRMTGQANATGKVTGSVDASVLGVGGFISVPLGDRGSFLFAMRRSPPASLYNSMLEYFAPGGSVAARDRSIRLSDGTTEAAPDSSFYDVNGKAELKLTGKDRVAFSLYTGRDDFNNSRDLPMGAAATTLHVVDDSYRTPSDAYVQIGDVRNWKARGLGGSWTRRWTPAVSTTLSIGRSTFENGTDQSSPFIITSTGEDDSLVALRAGYQGLNESNRLHDTTVRFDTLVELGFTHALSLGGEITSLNADYTVRQEAFKQAAGSGAVTTGLVDVLHLDDTARLTTVFAQDTWRPLARLVVSPGARLTRYDRAGVTYLEPRVSGVYQLTPFFRLTAGWSVDHQAVNRITREDRDHGDGAFWALADGLSIPIAQARQVVAGGSVGVRGFRFDFGGFYKTFEDLTLFAPRLFPGEAPDADRTMLYHGSGTAKGLELFFERVSDANTLRASYTWSRVEYAYPALEDEAFPAPFDRSHQFMVTDAARIWARLILSGAWVASTGRPYTARDSLEQVWFASGATTYRIKFDTKNSNRLPAYHRLDLSLRREFRLGAVRSTLGVTVFNVYGHTNVQYVDFQMAGPISTANWIAYPGRVVNVFVKIGF